MLKRVHTRSGRPTRLHKQRKAISTDSELDQAQSTVDLGHLCTSVKTILHITVSSVILECAVRKCSTDWEFGTLDNGLVKAATR
jgi:hypothetical protein